MKLKDVYPLYLNNKAVQPNTDLAVIDKFTGEVAFRTALATPDVIDEAIAGAVRAAEPMARLASFEKQDVLNHCVVRFKERYDDFVYLDRIVVAEEARSLWQAALRLAPEHEAAAEHYLDLLLSDGDPSDSVEALALLNGRAERAMATGNIAGAVRAYPTVETPLRS